MSRPRVIVCERRGIWAAGLKRFLPRETRVREMRVLADCQAELAAAPGSLLVVELSQANVEPVLNLFSRLNDRFSGAAAAVVAPRELSAYEPLVREAGSVYFTGSPRRCDVLARLVTRHLARSPATRLTLAAQVCEWLPWE